MSDTKIITAIAALAAAPRTKPSILPEPFASKMASRVKHPLSDLFGLTNFGVNITRILPNGISALRHAHSKQDEFVYILQGNPVLITDEGEMQLAPHMCAGFKAGTGNAHQLINRMADDVLYLEVGDRGAGDSVTYPDDDMQWAFVEDKWRFTHKDGSPY